jgi:hypothetical protein
LHDRLADREPDTGALDRGGSVGRRELDGVRDEVVQQLSEAAVVARVPERLAVVACELDTAGASPFWCD